MANCSCSGNSGSAYAAANRSGYGCLSSVPTAGGIAYNCFLPPTNMAYYQNFPFYNGPCGTVAGESDSNDCGCNNGGCNANCNNNWWNCCNNSGSDSEESQNSCCNPCGKGGNNMLCNCSCNPCNPCNPCCGPAAALVTSTGGVTTTAGGAVPLTLASQASNTSIPLALANMMGPISVVGDTVVFNCTGTYLVFLSVSLPGTTSYTGTIGLTVNGTPATTATQTLALTTTAYEGTSQALVRVTEGSTMTVNTSAALTAAGPGTAANVITLTIIRIA